MLLLYYVPSVKFNKPNTWHIYIWTADFNLEDVLAECVQFITRKPVIVNAANAHSTVGLNQRLG